MFFIYSHVIEEMTEDDKQLLLRGFYALDRNKSGIVTKNDIYIYLRGCGISRKEAKKQASSMVNLMDPSGKGKICLKDYVRARTLSTIQENYKNNDVDIEIQGLKILDPKNKGKINHQQLEEILTRSLPEKEKDQFMNAVRSNTVSSMHSPQSQLTPRSGSNTNKFQYPPAYGLNIDINYTGSNHNYNNTISSDTYAFGTPATASSSGGKITPRSGDVKGNHFTYNNVNMTNYCSGKLNANLNHAIAEIDIGAIAKLGSSNAVAVSPKIARDTAAVKASEFVFKK